MKHLSGPVAVDEDVSSSSAARGGLAVEGSGPSEAITADAWVSLMAIHSRSAIW